MGVEAVTHTGGVVTSPRLPAASSLHQCRCYGSLHGLFQVPKESENLSPFSFVFRGTSLLLPFCPSPPAAAAFSAVPREGESSRATSVCPRWLHGDWDKLGMGQQQRVLAKGSFLLGEQARSRKPRFYLTVGAVPVPS